MYDVPKTKKLKQLYAMKLSHGGQIHHGDVFPWLNGRSGPSCRRVLWYFRFLSFCLIAFLAPILQTITLLSYRPASQFPRPLLSRPSCPHVIWTFLSPCHPDLPVPMSSRPSCPHVIRTFLPHAFYIYFFVPMPSGHQKQSAR